VGAELQLLLCLESLGG